MEKRAAHDTGDVLLARNPGTIDFVDATRIVINTDEGGRDEYESQKFMRSNQGTLIHQKPRVKTGEEVRAVPPAAVRRLRHGRAASTGSGVESSTCRRTILHGTPAASEA